MTNFKKANELLKSNIMIIVMMLVIMYSLIPLFSLLCLFLMSMGIFGIVFILIFPLFYILLKIVVIYKFIINQDNFYLGRLFYECFECFKNNWKQMICSFVLYLSIIGTFGFIGLMPLLEGALRVISNSSIFLTPLTPSWFLYLFVLTMSGNFIYTYSYYRLCYKITGSYLNINTRKLISKYNKDIFVATVVKLILLMPLFSILLVSIIPLLGNIILILSPIIAFMFVYSIYFDFVIIVKIVLDVSEEASSTNTQ